MRPIGIIGSCLLSLLSVVILCLAIGAGPTQARWGADGLRSMYTIGAICLGAAVIGLIPLAIISIRWPDYIGQAALAGTAIRLMLTMAAAGVYQTLTKPHLASFLFWGVVFYCLLLATETIFGVWLVRRCYRVPSGSRGASA